MAHELQEHDSMFSVRERPWHGLGTVLEDYPDIDEAIQHSGLTWNVELKPLYYDAGGPLLELPEKFVTMRMDKNIPLGVVGRYYNVYQNGQMWEFIRQFCDSTGALLETAGSLYNGATVWVLAKNGEVEYLSGDPVQKFFLFRNGFDGGTNIQVLFTDIRVVCNNTLSMALRGAGNIYKVRHTAGAASNLEQIDRALKFHLKHEEAKAQAFDRLVRTAMSASEAEQFVDGLFRERRKEAVLGDAAVLKPGQALNHVPDYEDTERSAASRAKIVGRIMELAEAGAGADLPGVRGTAYGVFHAVAEYADHEAMIRPGQRDVREVRFESAMWGTAKDIKQRAFDGLLVLAA